MMNPMQHTHLADTLLRLRAESGLSLQDLRDALVRSGMPKRYVPSVAKLSRMETDGSARLDAITICAIAEVYGVSVRTISEEVANELEYVADLLEHRRPCTTARPGQLALAIA